MQYTQRIMPTVHRRSQCVLVWFGCSSSNIMFISSTIIHSFHKPIHIRKCKDYVYGIWVFKVLGKWKHYYGVKKITSFMYKTVNRGKK